MTLHFVQLSSWAEQRNVKKIFFWKKVLIYCKLNLLVCVDMNIGRREQTVQEYFPRKRFHSQSKLSVRTANKNVDGREKIAKKYFSRIELYLQSMLFASPHEYEN